MQTDRGENAFPTPLGSFAPNARTHFPPAQFRARASPLPKRSASSSTFLVISLRDLIDFSIGHHSLKTAGGGATSITWSPTKFASAGQTDAISSLRDTENADLDRERIELASDSEFELSELTGIYVKRGLDASLARQVAEQLMAHDALGAHARDELGISETMSARPVQAALASAATFAVGAALPLAAAFLSPERLIAVIVSITSLGFLALLGGLSASAGGAPIAKAVARVTFWGTLAMAATAGIGALFGVAA